MRFWKTVIAGATAGTVTGLLGAGGGMILVPLLRQCGDLEDSQVFPCSISIILPLCVVTLTLNAMQAPLPFSTALPYLLGSALGGVAAGLLGKKIPTLWLHRILGGLILYGGWRYLC